MIMTFELRQCAMQCADRKLRKELKDCADNLGLWLKLLAATPDENNMQRVNGLWALGQRLITRYDLGGPTGGKGGAKSASDWKDWPAADDEDALRREAA